MSKFKIDAELYSELMGRKYKRGISFDCPDEIDFREWDAEATIQAWSEHNESITQCMLNVSPMKHSRVYAKLLEITANEAKKFLLHKRVLAYAKQLIAESTIKGEYRIEVHLQ